MQHDHPVYEIHNGPRFTFTDTRLVIVSYSPKDGSILLDLCIPYSSITRVTYNLSPHVEWPAFTITYEDNGEQASQPFSDMVAHPDILAALFAKLAS